MCDNIRDNIDFQQVTISFNYSESQYILYTLEQDLVEIRQMGAL